MSIKWYLSSTAQLKSGLPRTKWLFYHQALFCWLCRSVMSIFQRIGGRVLQLFVLYRALEISRLHKRQEDPFPQSSYQRIFAHSDLLDYEYQTRGESQNKSRHPLKAFRLESQVIHCINITIPCPEPCGSLLGFFFWFRKDRNIATCENLDVPTVP